MIKEKISFTKNLNFVNPYYNFHNTCNYNIVENNSIKSSLKVMSSFTSELHTECKMYLIKPVTRFLTVKCFEVLLGSDQIGRIEYWGWTWKKPKLIIHDQGNEQVWIYERNEPKPFNNRTSPYTTKLKYQDREIVYEIELDKSINGNENLSELKGIAYFDEETRLPCLLGIFLNELLIFDEMDK